MLVLQSVIEACLQRNLKLLTEAEFLIMTKVANTFCLKLKVKLFHVSVIVVCP